MQSSLYYARKVCDTMMKKYDAEKLPPEGFFHYHQGVFLSGMLNTYKKSKDEKYYEYIKRWVDSIVYEDGSIHSFREEMLDDIQPAILLFDLYKRTGDKRYTIALQTLINVLREWPRNPVGGFWHKYVHKNEMWLDGLYMAGPLEAQYSAEFGDTSFAETAIEQIIIMYENMRDKETGLLYHAWDYYRQAPWADPETGLAPEFWGRALGWYVVAILDILEFVPKDHPKRQIIVHIEQEVLDAIVKYQDTKSGMWYQVVNKGAWKGNWLESSCSSLFAYALAKSVRLGICDKKYLDVAQKAFDGIVNHSVEHKGEEILIKNICVGTGVCDYDGYISRPTSTNDLHGAGAFLLMCTELMEPER